MDEKCVHGVKKMDCEICWNLENAVENIGLANLLRQTGMENLRVVQQRRRQQRQRAAGLLLLWARMFGDE